jgi:hypothetical protein
MTALFGSVFMAGGFDDHYSLKIEDLKIAHLLWFVPTAWPGAKPLRQTVRGATIKREFAADLLQVQQPVTIHTIFDCSTRLTRKAHIG